MDFVSFAFPPHLRGLLEDPSPPDADIPVRKVTEYLLAPKAKDDKSTYLARAGFWPSNAGALLAALHEFRVSAEAEFVCENAHGQFFQAVGILRGPNGRNLWIKTIWMKESLPGKLRLITLVPFPSASVR